MLESARLVSIIREVEEKEIISIIEGLVEEGIRWFEISLSDGENGMKCIRTSRKYFEGRDLPEHLQKLRKRMLRCMIKKAIRFMFTITISFS